MQTINTILAHSGHRPWPKPNKSWQYYQEWNKAVFLHWRVPVSTLRELVPAALQIDTINGHAWVSVVAFTMQNIRPKNLPAIRYISDFHEINVRTYVTHNSKAGVYFLNIEASKILSVIIAKALSGLPYIKAKISRKGLHYNSENKTKAFFLDMIYAPREHITGKSALDNWLTERYCLYLENNNALFRFDIHHKPWQLQQVSLPELSLYYKTGNTVLNCPPHAAHYSEGVQVIAWRKEKL